MTEHRWPADTLTRAEQALAELEAFWERFQGGTTHSRQLELPHLLRIRHGIASATNSDAYALEILTRLDGVCHRLARELPPLDFDEERTLIQGFGDVWNMRGLLVELGLVKDAASEVPN